MVPPTATPDDAFMVTIDDAAQAAFRVHERWPELPLDVLYAAAAGAMEVERGPDLEAVIERIARAFAGVVR